MADNKYIAFFKDSAELHKDIRHNQPAEEGSDKKRNSFFRRSKEHIFNISSDAAYPALVLMTTSGRLEHGSRVADVKTGSFIIMQAVDDIKDMSMVDEAQEACLQIGFHIIARMNNKMEEQGKNGPVPGFDINTVRYSLTDAIDGSRVAAVFTFNYKMEAFNPYSLNLDEIFITP